jgi:hypothetical protein
MAGAGVLEFQGNGQHTGSFGTGGSGQIQFTTGTQELMTGTTFSGSILATSVSALNVPAGQSVTNSGTFQLDGGAILSGSGVTAADGQFGNSGSFLWTGGTILNLSLTNNAMGNMQLSGSRKFLDGSLLQNFGAITWLQGNISMSTSNNNCTILNSGSFNVQANGFQVFDRSRPLAGFFATIVNTGPGMAGAPTGSFFITGGAATTVNVAFDNWGYLNRGVTWGTGNLTIPRLTDHFVYGMTDIP